MYTTPNDYASYDVDPLHVVNRLLAWTYDIGDSNVGGALTNGTVHLVAIGVPRRCTANTLRYLTQRTGVYTAGAYNGVGLYASDGTTLTLVGSSADDPNCWKQGYDQWVKKSFTAPLALSADMYYAAALYTASAETTSPALYRKPTGLSSLVNDNCGTNQFRAGSLAGQTSLPATIAHSAVTLSNYAVFNAALL